MKYYSTNKETYFEAHYSLKSCSQTSRAFRRYDVKPLVLLWLNSTYLRTHACIHGHRLTRCCWKEVHNKYFWMSSWINFLELHAAERKALLIAIHFIILPPFVFPHRKNGNASTNPTIRMDSEHNLQEYTYKKITPCDVCSQVLRGKCWS